VELKEALSSLEVQEACGRDVLRVYGLRWSAEDEQLRYVTLDEALAGDQVDITEVDRGGRVPELKVVNRGETMLFIMAGEELAGAKQNRVMNTSIMVKPKSEQNIPVSCVEAGRWAYRSPKFRSSGATSHRTLRMMMAKQMSASYKLSGSPRSDQGEVWAEIESKLQRMGSRSPSSELNQVYRDKKEKLDEIVEKIQAPEGCCGAVFVSGNRILGLDVFDKQSTLRKMWPKLLRGYAVDALEDAASQADVSAARVQDWLSSLPRAKAERHKSPGLGDDVRLQADDTHGGALIVENSPVHVEVFCDDPAKA